jgi:hypothetical protein
MYTKKHNQKKNLLGRTEGIESAFDVVFDEKITTSTFY